MRKLLRPKYIREAVRQLTIVRKHGGPKRIHVLHVGRPHGLIVNVSELTLEVEAKDGTRHKIETAVPLPFFYAWAYKLARILHIPLISSLDPERVHFSVPVPSRRRTQASS
jgi:hypothetical protein